MRYFGISMAIRKYKWTIWGCIFAGVAAHFYALTNTLQNYDNIYVNPIGYGTGVQSGRWLLSVLGNIIEMLGGSYNLSYFNGLFTVLLLTITAVLIADLFHLSDKCGFLLGGVFLSYPTVTATLFFMYTAPYYAFGVLMAVMAVWCVVKYRRGFIFAVILEACSMGIYQAYIPMTATLFVLLLIVKTFENGNIKQIFKRAFYYLLVLVSGFVFYFFCLWFFLTVSHTELTDYVNIDQMGRITLADIPNILVKCYSIFYQLLIKNYYGIVSGSILRLCVLTLGLAVIGMLVYLWKNRRLNISNILICALLYLGFYPVALNGVEVICFNSRIYVLMIYSTVFIFVLPLLLLDLIMPESKEGSRSSILRKRWIKVCSVSVLTAVSIVILSYIYSANINYSSMYYMNQQTTNYLNRLIVRVQEVDGYDVSYQWALIGDRISDPSYVNPWEVAEKYGGNANSLINQYSRDSYIRNYLGFSYQAVEESVLEELRKNDEVRRMPLYPNAGSIKVIDNVVVIKFSEEQ